ncbi:MAG: thioesterase domain-containing protein, partial [Limnothrix sp.]
IVSSLTELEKALESTLKIMQTEPEKNIIQDRIFLNKVNKRLRKKALLTAVQEVENISNFDRFSQEDYSDKILLEKVFSHLCKLWSEGLNFDWKTLYPTSNYPLLAIPTYSFDRQSFWIAQPPEDNGSIKNKDKRTSIKQLTTKIQKKLTTSTNFVSPRTNLEKQLAKVWQNVLGVSEISITDNFFELGGTSKLSIKLISEIEKNIGRQLPLYALFELTTISQQAWFIEQKSLLDSKNLSTNFSSEESEFTLEDYKACLSMVIGRLGKRHNKGALIVGLNTLGDRQPIFCCANGYKEVQPLTMALGRTYPFYLLESGYSIFRRNIKGKIEGLAKKQVEEILEIQPQSPYVIVGYSFGSLVAYEVAQQLTEMGKEVKALVILDYPGNKETAQSLLYPGQTLNRLQHLRSKKLPSQQKKVEPYKFKNYSGKLILFFARNSFRNFASGYRKLIPLWLTPREGWPVDVAPDLDVKIVPGNHFTILKEPAVQALAKKLAVYLDK